MLSVIAVFVATWFGPATERMLTVFFISLTAVVGIGVYSGNSGILSFGHVAFMGVGAYASSLLTVPAALKGATLPGLPTWLADVELTLIPATLIAMVFTAVVALAVGAAISKLEGSAATIATLGLLIIVHGVIIGWRDVTRGAQSFFGVPRVTDLVTAAAFCVVALLLARLYRDSVSGLRLRAGRENAIAAGAVGVRIRWERLISFVLAAAIMALAGAMMAHFLGAFSPKKFYFNDTFLLLAMLIVGGMSTVTGAITGAVVITLVTEILRRLESGFSIGVFDVPPIFGTAQIGIGLIILLAMFRKVDGLAGLKEWEERVLPGSTLIAQVAPPSVGAQDVLSGEGLTMQFGGLTAVDDVSIQILPGQIVGLIGPNGSGKTTLVNLLLRHHDPDVGQVLVDGEPVSSFTLDSLRRCVGVVSQRVELLNASIADNLRLVAPAAGDGELWRVLGEVGLADEVRGMEAGLRTVVGPAGTRLSGGQAQRLTVARVILQRPRVLILDEFTASVDPDLAAEIRVNLARCLPGVTVVEISHECDCGGETVVLDRGRVVKHLRR